MLDQVTLSPVLPKIDAEQATRHLDLLHRGAEGYVSFVLLGNKKRERHSFAPVEDLRKRFNGEIAANSRGHLEDIVINGHWNVYTACSTFAKIPMKDGKPRGRGTREDISSVPGVWCDLDVKPGTEDYFQTEDQLQQFVDRLPVPTMEIASGSGGRHLYWLTNERLSIARATKTLPAWLDFLRAEADGAVVENVMDTTRILRLAGTIRWPKVDDSQATLPMPVTLIKDDGPRYAVDELDLWSESAAHEAEIQREVHRREWKVISEARMSQITQYDVDLLEKEDLEKLYNQYEDWAALLEPDGWTEFSDQREGPARCRYWCRPGKSIKDGKSASTDYVTPHGISPIMTIYSNDPALDPLRQNSGSSDAHGLCSKFHYALHMHYNEKLLPLLYDIRTRVRIEGWR